MKTIGYAIGLLTLTCLIGSCSGQKNTSTGQSSESPKAQGGDDANNSRRHTSRRCPRTCARSLDTSFTGDFDQMVKRRLIRVGVTFNRTFYFVDKGVQRGCGLRVRAARSRTHLNKKLKTGNLKVHVVLVPLPRDLLLPALQSTARSTSSSRS